MEGLNVDHLFMLYEKIMFCPDTLYIGVYLVRMCEASVLIDDYITVCIVDDQDCLT